jgi:hypothetical protein
MAITNVSQVLFKPVKCTKAKLNSQPLQEGIVYFCTDNQELYIDATVDNTLKRILIANNYELPNATSTTLGGIKVGDNITLENGQISLKTKNVTDALGYTPLQYQNLAELSSSTTSNTATVKLVDGSKTTNVKVTGEGLIGVAEGSSNEIKITTSATENEASTTTPLMAGTASVGKEAGYARGDHVHPAQVDITGNAATADLAKTAESVYIKSENSSNMTSYDILFDETVSASGERALNKSSNNDLKIQTKKGTTSAEGVMKLMLGNSLASTQDLNSTGEVVLYGGNGSATTIFPNNGASSTRIILPAASGTLVTSDQVGNSLSVDGRTVSLKSASGASLSSIQTQDTTYSIADSTTPGLVKIGYTQSGKNYPVQLSNEKMYVNVPWIDAEATTSAKGLMSSTDKTKLDGIAEGANKYVLPSATSTALGGVKNGSSVTNSSGYEPTPIINDVPYYKVYTSLKNPTSLTIQTNGTTQATYDGSAAKSVNITWDSVGAAAKTHTHNANDISEGTLALDRLPTIPESKLGTIDASKLTGTISAELLPGSYDEVQEYDDINNFPKEGSSARIYVDSKTNLIYRWTGSTYIEISASLALGITESTACRGDLGQTAYEHASARGIALTSGLYKIQTNSEGHVEKGTSVVKTDITALGIPAQDTTYSVASSNSGLTLSGTTFSHSNILSAKGSASGTATSTLKYGGTFNIPVINYDINGHITSAGTTTLTMPSEVHYQAVMRAGNSSSTSNDATTNGNTYIKTVETLDGAALKASSLKVVGSGLTKVTSDSSGAVTISSDVPDELKLYQFPKTLKISSTTWTDTGIAGASLPTGTYAIRVSGTIGSTSDEAWSGVMSWYSGTCTANVGEEVILHNAGSSDSEQDIYIQTTRTSGGYMSLQISGNFSKDSNAITFSFRRLI